MNTPPSCGRVGVIDNCRFASCTSQTFSIPINTYHLNFCVVICQITFVVVVVMIVEMTKNYKQLIMNMASLCYLKLDGWRHGENQDINK